VDKAAAISTFGAGHDVWTRGSDFKRGNRLPAEDLRLRTPPRLGDLNFDATRAVKFRSPRQYLESKDGAWFHSPGRRHPRARGIGNAPTPGLSASRFSRAIDQAIVEITGVQWATAPPPGGIVGAVVRSTRRQPQAPVARATLPPLGGKAR